MGTHDSSEQTPVDFVTLSLLDAMCVLWRAAMAEDVIRAFRTALTQISNVSVMTIGTDVRLSDTGGDNFFRPELSLFVATDNEGSGYSFQVYWNWEKDGLEVCTVNNIVPSVLLNARVVVDRSWIADGSPIPVPQTHSEQEPQDSGMGNIPLSIFLMHHWHRGNVGYIWSAIDQALYNRFAYQISDPHIVDRRCVITLVVEEINGWRHTFKYDRELGRSNRVMEYLGNAPESERPSAMFDPSKINVRIPTEYFLA